MSKTELPKRKSAELSDQSFTFRRSRTLTGSLSTSVRSAGEYRAELQSPRLHEHTLRKHRRRLGAFLLISVLLIAALWMLVTSFIGGVSSFAIHGTASVLRPLQEETYRSITMTYLNDHPLERFSFNLDEDQFAKYLVSQAPELTGATVEPGQFLEGGLLTLSLREPVVAWTIKDKQYFVDKTGTPFTVNYFSTPTVVVTDKSGVNADAGVIASTKLLKFIGRVTVIVNESDTYSVEKVELPAGSTRQVNFKLFGRDFIFKTNLDRDPAGQAADILNSLKHIEANAITPEYVDVRVSSKAFYRDAR